MAAPYVTSKVFDPAIVRHGFFGREGGRSMGALAANNMSVTVGDNPDLVVANRSSASFAMGGHPLADLVVFRQIHSARVVTLTERPPPGIAIEADAMVTNRRDLLLGILTADCAPILLADPNVGIVGAVHAGWRGAAEGIAKATVDAMVVLGATPRNIVAAIGPAICGANYEIGPERATEVVALNPAAGPFIAVPAGAEREHLDLPAMLQHELLDIGIGLASDLDLCTYADPARWYSHRYATHQNSTTGRQISIIGLC